MMNWPSLTEYLSKKIVTLILGCSMKAFIRFTTSKCGFDDNASSIATRVPSMSTQMCRKSMLDKVRQFYHDSQAAHAHVITCKKSSTYIHRHRWTSSRQRKQQRSV